MKKIEKTGNQIIFEAEINETLANAIRRYVNQIPVMAVDEVEISKNDSPLYDETIAHRIGLLPLKTDKSVTKKSTGKLKLEIKKEGTIYSRDIRGKPEVVYKNMPITILSKNQELKLTAFVKSGKGAKHARFSPGLLFYRNVNEIILDKEFYEEIKEVCYGNEIKEKGNKIVITDNKKREVADVCEGIANRKGKKAEINPKKEMVITLESFGQMGAGDIFVKAIEVLKKDIASLSKSIEKA